MTTDFPFELDDHVMTPIGFARVVAYCPTAGFEWVEIVTFSRSQRRKFHPRDLTKLTHTHQIEGDGYEE